MRRLFAIVGVGAALLAPPGCGPSAATSEMETSAEAEGLRNLGAMYKIVGDSLGRPPRNIGELRPAEAQVPGGFSSLGETNAAIYFDAKLPEKGDPGAADTVLAYDRVVPRQGGFVLMLDGSVRKMTAEEFKAAKKAGKTPWVAPAGS